MKTVNRTMLLGNATRDAELKKLPSGRDVCTFGLATNRVWKDKAGQRQSVAEFHNLVAWGQLAGFCAEYIRKGKPLYVEGYLHTRSWEAENGTKQYRTEVVVENLVLIGPKAEAEAPKLQDDEVPAEEAAPVA
ncbi:MAG TPA: single-stranded DNA-binding protein [Candidatus Peribacteria bacterium]|nr:single-stranded DNA-binding protein [Candidatus Peribacteria bacterium]